jgi:hypothetical protein
MKYTFLITSLLVMLIESALAQANNIPNAMPPKSDNLKKIEPSVHVSKDSAVILLNNKFYRLSELKEYNNNTIDGVVIESVYVVKDKEVIAKILSDKIKVLIIVNAPKNLSADSLKQRKRN